MVAILLLIYILTDFKNACYLQIVRRTKSCTEQQRIKESLRYMHLYLPLLNDKSSCTHFLIQALLITVIFQSQVMTSFFATLAAYECL